MRARGVVAFGCETVFAQVMVGDCKRYVYTDKKQIVNTMGS